MLLEYYLNSTPTEANSAGQKSALISQNKSNDAVKRSAEEFKSALNNSLESIRKNQYKQSDSSPSEGKSIAVSKGESNAKVSSETESQENKTTGRRNEDTGDVNRNINKKIVGLPEDTSKLNLGEIVPADGSLLPSSAVISTTLSDKTSAEKLPTELLTSKPDKQETNKTSTENVPTELLTSKLDKQETNKTSAEKVPTELLDSNIIKKEAVMSSTEKLPIELQTLNLTNKELDASNKASLITVAPTGSNNASLITVASTESNKPEIKSSSTELKESSISNLVNNDKLFNGSLSSETQKVGEFKSLELTKAELIAEGLKAKELMTTELKSPQPDTQKLTTGFDLNSELQRKPDVNNLSNVSNAKLDSIAVTKDSANLIDNKQQITTTRNIAVESKPHTQTPEVAKDIDLLAIKGVKKDLQQHQVQLDELKTTNIAPLVINKNLNKNANKNFDANTNKYSDKLSVSDDAVKLVENMNNFTKSRNTGEHFVVQAARDESIFRALTQTVETVNSTSTEAKSNAFVITENLSVVQSLNQTSGHLQVTRASDVPLQVSVPTPQWNQKFAEHVSMLALRGANNAQIRLDPPELGPMAIRINHQGSETHIQFTVHNPVARELVDSGMQRLRDMLEQHGFENVNVDVSEFSQKDASSDESEFNEQNVNEQYTESKSISDIKAPLQSTALIDLFV